MRSSVVLFFFQLLLLAILAVDKKPIAIEDVTDKVLDERAKKTEFVLAFFYSEKTEKTDATKKALVQLNHVAKHALIGGLQILKVKNSKRVNEHGFKTLPKILFFRKDLPILYESEAIDGNDIITWMEQNREISIKTLGDDDFEHLTQAATGATTGDWLVMFYQKKCSGLLPAFEAAASRLKYKSPFARVDLMASPKLLKRFQITKCPTFRFFKNGKMYHYDLPNKDVKNMVNFVEGFYKNVKSQPVPGEPSPFDNLVDGIALTLKAHIKNAGSLLLTLVGAGVVLFAAIIIFCCCCRGDGRRRPKFD